METLHFQPWSTFFGKSFGIRGRNSSVFWLVNYQLRETLLIDFGVLYIQCGMTYMLWVCACVHFELSKLFRQCYTSPSGSSTRSRMHCLCFTDLPSFLKAMWPAEVEFLPLLRFLRRSEVQASWRLPEWLAPLEDTFECVSLSGCSVVHLLRASLSRGPLAFFHPSRSLGHTSAGGEIS